MKDRIEDLREKMYKMIEADDREGILEISKELDKLIIEYIKEKESIVENE